MERRPVERVRGTQDFWAPEALQLAALRRRLEATFESFGYSHIEVPVIEPAELHLRKSGLEIISKLYAFEDQGGRRLCLRPELTASVVRAFVAQPPARLPVRLFSSGPVFRYERPSRGRYRQFTQCGVELIGAEGAAADAEVVSLAMHALDRQGLRQYRVTLGHVGILGQLLTRLGMTGRLRAFLVESLEEARRRGIAAVRRRLAELDPDLFQPASAVLPEVALPQAPAGPITAVRANGAAHARADVAAEAEVRSAVVALLTELGAEALGRRSESEVVERVLHKLHPGARHEAVERALVFMERLAAIRGAPAEAFAAGRALLDEHGLDNEPLEELRGAVGLLEEFGADVSRVQVDLGLGRGLQYYTGTVFEIDHAGLGSESQLCGGGRYDDLSRALGARHALPALGFAFGVERVRLALEAEGQGVESDARAQVYVVPASGEQLGYAARVAQALRDAGVAARLEISRRPLRASLAFADKEGFSRVVIVGEAEQRDGTMLVREMAGGAERTLALAAAGELV